jgi:hypothetical protein
MGEDGHVTEFQQISDPARPAARWYPKEFYRTSDAGEMRFVVTEVKFNERFQAAEFRPDLPEGTLVYERSAVPGEPTRRFVVGGKQSADDVIRARVKEADAISYPVAPGAPTVHVSMTPAWPISRIVFWCSLSLLLIGGGLLLRSKLAQ